MQFELSYHFDLIFMGFYYHMITMKTLQSYLTFAKQALKIKGSIFFLKKKIRFRPKIRVSLGQNAKF